MNYFLIQGVSILGIVASIFFALADERYHVPLADDLSKMMPAFPSVIYFSSMFWIALSTGMIMEGLGNG